MRENADHLYILGDFSDRCVSWNDDHSSSELGLEFHSMVANNGLTLTINEVTRITPHSAYLLDLLITDSPNLYNKRDFWHSLQQNL